jgi:hypothetical protein
MARIGGSLILLAWDLALDPAMSYATRYWVWGETGPYYGMPWLNLFGWYVTGLALMGVLDVVPRGRWTARIDPAWWLASMARTCCCRWACAWRRGCGGRGGHATWLACCGSRWCGGPSRQAERAPAEAAHEGAGWRRRAEAARRCRMLYVQPARGFGAPAEARRAS